jgi:DNA-binding CsgD family transcriptional regulator
MEPDTAMAESVARLLVDGRKSLLDFSSMDWSKSSIELAKENGLSVETFKRQRRRHAPETVKPAAKIIDWSIVDWSKTSREIAHDLSVPKSTVTQARHIYAPDTVVPRAPMLNVDWPNVDWYGLGTKEIAQMHGVSTSIVSSYRKRYAPSTVLTQRKRYDWSNVDWSKSNVDIATSLGMDFPKEKSGYIKKMRQLWAPHTVQPVRRIDWSNVEFSKPTSQIARELGVDPNSVRRKKDTLPESIVDLLLR